MTMSETKDNRIKRLPKWAQELILRQQQTIHDQRDELSARTRNSPSFIAVRDLRAIGDRRNERLYLDNRSQIVFQLSGEPGEQERDKQIITVSWADDSIRVSADGYPFQLAALPQSSNVLRIKVSEG